MNKIIIPKKFQQFGSEISVEYCSTLHEDGCLGRTILDENKIRINNKDIPRDLIEHTYYHELVHVMLEMLGMEKISKDEAKVDSIAGLLHQHEKTKKGDLDEVVQEEERD